MMSAQLIKDVEKERHHVVVDFYQPMWSELLTQYKNGDISVNPVYQRGFRWSSLQQSMFIESLLLNIPTPPIFLAEQPDSRFEIIDGLQRFSTLVKFFSAEIFPEDEIKPPYKNDENDLYVPSELVEPPILEKLAGLTRESMPETLLRTLRYSRLQVILLKKESSPVAKYNVFTRLNRAGSKLSDQEIRNCSARLFDSAFPDALREIAQNSNVKAAMALSKADLQSMETEENVLRLLAFSHSKPSNKNITEFLDKFMYLASSQEFKFTPKMKANVIKTFDLIAAAFPQGEAFKFYREQKFSGAFSTNLFDIIACGVYQNITSMTKKSPAQLRTQVKALHKEQEALELTGAGSNTTKKMSGRVSFGKKWFA
jgi:hypothetical protein